MKIEIRYKKTEEKETFINKENQNPNIENVTYNKEKKDSSHNFHKDSNISKETVTLILNNEIPFKSLNEFHKFLQENDINNYTNELGFIQLTISIIKASDNLEFILPFDCNFVLTPIQFLKINKNILNHGQVQNPNLNKYNNIFLVATSCDKINKLEHCLDSISEALNTPIDNANCLVVLTKPDRIDGLDHYNNISQFCQKLNLKYLFIKMRNDDERTSNLVSELIDNEKYFFESKKYFKGNKIGIKNVLEFIYFSYSKIFENNYNNNEKTFKKISSKINEELNQLGKALPADGKEKMVYLKNTLKFVITYIQDIVTFNSQQLVSLIEKMQGVNYQDKYYLNNEISSVIYNLKSYTSHDNFFRKKLDKQVISKQQLENHIWEYSKKIIEKNIERIKLIFTTNIQINKNEISKKVLKVFRNILDSFNEKLIEYFNSIIDKYSHDTFNLLSKFYDEIELSIFYYPNENLYENVNEFYNNLLQKDSNFAYTQNYSAFLRDSTYAVIKSKLETFITNYSKIFSFHCYSKIKDCLADISIEKLIYDDLDFSEFDEEEEIKVQRNYLNDKFYLVTQIEDLGKLIFNKFHIYHNPHVYINRSFGMKSHLDVKDINIFKSLVMNKIPVEDFEDNAKYEWNHDEGELLPPNENENFYDHRQKEIDNTIYLEDEEIIFRLDKRISSKLLVSEDVPLEFLSFYRNNRKELVFVWDNANYITVYSIENESLKQEIIGSIPYNNFLEDNRYININSSIYITGGKKEKGECSKLFYELKRPENTIILLPNIPVPVIRHSLIYIKNKDSLILSSGLNNKKSFLFKICDKTWSDNGELRYYREDPSLFLLNDYTLFCAGGVVDKNLNDNAFLVEYKEFDSCKWKLLNINFSHEIKINLNLLCGMGIIAKENKLLLVGGYEYNKKAFTDQDTIYEISLIRNHNEVYLEAQMLYEISTKEHTDWKGWFPENNFVKNENIFINFDVDGNIILYNSLFDHFDRIDYELTIN